MARKKIPGRGATGGNAVPGDDHERRGCNPYSLAKAGSSAVTVDDPPRKKARKPSGSVLIKAYEILGVTPSDVAIVPRIEHLFRGIGGKAEVFKFIAGSEDPKARKIIELRGKLTAEQARVLPFEAFCVAIGASTKEIFGLIAQETFDQSRRASQLLRDAKLAKVVDYTVDQAMTPAGTQERKMILQSGGMVPLPKTVLIPVHGDMNVDARQQTVKLETAVLEPVEHLVKRLSDRFNDRFNQHVTLPSAEDGEEEDYDGDDEAE